MKSIIIYFSQTGNTELIARTIQKGIQKAAGQCDIVKIKDANPRRLHEYDLIGLGTPILGFREPVNVRAFIKNMRFVGGKHAFAFCTHGTVPEFFFPKIVPNLKRRGLTIIGMYNCYAACYMANMPDPYPTGRHPDEIDLKEAEAFGKDMVERSQRIYAGETKLIPSMPKWARSDLRGYLQARRQKELDMGVPPLSAARTSSIKHDKEKCRYPKCRICMDNCPVDGIDLSVNPPVIAKPCMRCSFCIKICPTGALENTAEMVAYPEDIHKKVFNEFYMKPIAKAEAEGRFRRNVPVDEVGFDNPIIKKHNKHPMWIIGKGLH